MSSDNQPRRSTRQLAATAQHAPPAVQAQPATSRIQMKRRTVSAVRAEQDKARSESSTAADQASEYFGRGGLRGYMTAAEVEALWSPEYAEDVEWTEEDEATFQQKWRPYFDRMGKVDTLRMDAATRACLQAMRCSPYAIISPRYGLWYLKYTADGIDNDAFMWSQGFCQKFQRVVVNPVFRGKASNLVTALIYGAAVLVQDHSPRQIPGASSCGIISQLIADVSMPRFSGCFHETHKRIRVSFEADGLDASSQSDFLFYLGGVAVDRRSPETPRREDGGLSVNGQLLDMIITALECWTWAGRKKGGIASSKSVEDSWRLYSDNKGVQSAGTAASKLSIGLEKSWRSELKAAKTVVPTQQRRARRRSRSLSVFADSPIHQDSDDLYLNGDDDWVPPIEEPSDQFFNEREVQAPEQPIIESPVIETPAASISVPVSNTMLPPDRPTSGAAGETAVASQNERTTATHNTFLSVGAASPVVDSGKSAGGTVVASQTQSPRLEIPDVLNSAEGTIEVREASKRAAEDSASQGFSFGTGRKQWHNEASVPRRSRNF